MKKLLVLWSSWNNQGENLAFLTSFDWIPKKQVLEENLALPFNGFVLLLYAATCNY